jgi:hypothetical protein
MQDLTNRWFHWAVYNIPSKIDRIELGAGNSMWSLPFKSHRVTNDFGIKEYVGPCIFDGRKHTYTITIYALDREIFGVETPMRLIYLAEKYKIASSSIKSFYGEFSVVDSKSILGEKNAINSNKTTPKTTQKTNNVLKKNTYLPIRKDDGSINTEHIKKNIDKATEKAKKNSKIYFDVIKSKVGTIIDSGDKK